MKFPQAAFISFDLIDAAGILFFCHVFTLSHHIFETLVISQLSFSWNEWFNNGQWIAPIKQCEALYKKPLFGGQSYDVEAIVSSISNSTFTITYIFSQKQEEYCSVKIVHIFCKKNSGKKCPIPSLIRRNLEKS